MGLMKDMTATLSTIPARRQKLSARRRLRGFTLVEVMVALVVSLAVCEIAYYFFTAGVVLYAKNCSLNYSNNSARYAIDRITRETSSAVAIPDLMSVAANGAVSGPVSGTAAAGIRFDQVRGSHYLIVHPGGSGLAANATSFQIQCSTDSFAASPAPEAGDWLAIDDASSAHAVIATCTPVSLKNKVQTYRITLKSPLGVAVPWFASDIKTSSLMRRSMFVVKDNELRYFDSAEGVSNANAGDYVVIASNIGAGSGDGAPFSKVTQDSQTFLNISLRVQEGKFNNYLSNKEASSFNSFTRLDTKLRPPSAM